MRFAGEGKRHHGAAMESIIEGDDGGAFGIGAGDFDGIFDRFGARIDEQSLFGEFSRRERIQFFGYGDVALVRRDAEAEVQIFFELRADGVATGALQMRG